MGVDTRIVVKTKSGQPPSAIYRPGVMFDDTEGGRFELDNPWRFYGVGYERGPWPDILAAILYLLTEEDVESVWYCGDCEDIENIGPVTLEELEAITRHYVANGTRPYFNKPGWALGK